MIIIITIIIIIIILIIQIWTDGHGRGLLAAGCHVVPIPKWKRSFQLEPRAHAARRHRLHFSTCARHPCAGAMLIFPVSFQCQRMIPEGNPQPVAILG